MQPHPRRLAIVGATGILGRPVTDALIAAGYDVTIGSRHPERARERFPAARHLPVDLLDRASVRRLLDGQDALYLSLSVPRGERPDAPHAEAEGLRHVLDEARATGLRRIGYLSSLVQQYQGMNGFDWWVFRVKEAAVQMLAASGVPYTVFRASTFMESFTDHYRVGRRILVVGRSEQPQYLIAARDFGKQVAQAFALDAAANRVYAVQGPEPFTTEAAAEVVRRHSLRDLAISRAPMGLVRFFGRISREADYGAHIIEAINRYPETFEAEDTWRDLGRPTTTLAAFARAHG